jgi:hypothetical protein
MRAVQAGGGGGSKWEEEVQEEGKFREVAYQGGKRAVPYKREEFSRDGGE